MSLKCDFSQLSPRRAKNLSRPRKSFHRRRHFFYSCINSFLHLILVLLFAVSVAGTAADEAKVPRIATKGSLVRVQVGDTMKLPCRVFDLGELTIVWKKGNRVFAAGNKIVRRDRRISLQGSDLEITGMNVHDGGEYSCEVENDHTDQPLSVVHTVEILVPPTVSTEPASGEVIVRRSTSVSLECKANGNPPPSVTWVKMRSNRREDEVVDPRRRFQPSQLSNNGLVLTLSDVTRHDAGRYRCTASNDVGRDAEGFIHLRVLYKPEITVDSDRVHGGEGYAANLTCHIHANPRATVTWTKNSLPVENGPRYRLVGDSSVANSGGRRLLVIPRLGVEDFANYSCIAINSMGKEEAIMEVTGNPSKPRFSSVVRFIPGSNLWRIAWLTESYANISEYRLLYRKVPVSSSPHETSYAWNNVILPKRNHRRGFEQKFTYDLRGLSFESEYEAQVQAKNKFGWSQRSESLRFRTTVVENRSTHEEQRTTASWRTKNNNNNYHHKKNRKNKNKSSKFEANAQVEVALDDEGVGLTNSSPSAVRRSNPLFNILINIYAMTTLFKI